jgi:2-phosphosulfolactate phosphatase
VNVASPGHDQTANQRRVVIESFAGNFGGFEPDYTVVAIDVIRATTMAVTAVLLGRRCFPAASIDAAVDLAKRLDEPLLAGELGGNMPYGFHIDNSPVALAERVDTRPLVLLSTSGTELICTAAESSTAVYVACLRNVTAQAAHLIDRHPRVALIGAGSRGEFREEDQLCCAWIAARLIDAGYESPGDTARLVERWRYATVTEMLVSNSVRYLQSTGRQRDLEFILQHIDDTDAVFAFTQGEIIRHSCQQ